MNLFYILIKFFFILFVFTSCTKIQVEDNIQKKMFSGNLAEENSSNNDSLDNNSSDNNLSDNDTSKDYGPSEPGELGNQQSQQNGCEGEIC